MCLGIPYDWDQHSHWHNATWLLASNILLFSICMAFIFPQTSGTWWKSPLQALPSKERRSQKSQLCSLGPLWGVRVWRFGSARAIPAEAEPRTGSSVPLSPALHLLGQKGRGREGARMARTLQALCRASCLAHLCCDNLSCLLEGLLSAVLICRPHKAVSSLLCAEGSVTD